MNQLTEQTKGNTALDENAELGFGTLLVAEDEDGGYEPVRVVTTISEAREVAAEDFGFRIADLDNGNSPLCPSRYAIWVRRFAGYEVLTTIDPA